MAQLCVDAAKKIAGLLPDMPDQYFLYNTGPWWIIIHNLMQSFSVLLLEISFNAAHVAPAEEAILPFVQKLLRWLRALKEHNDIAEKAYRTALIVLRMVASRLNLDISSLLDENPLEDINPFSTYYDQTFNAPQQGFSHPASNIIGATFPETGGSSMTHPQSKPNISGRVPSLARTEPSLPMFFNTTDYYRPNPNPYFQPTPFYTTFDEQNPFAAIADEQQLDMPDLTMQGYPEHEDPYEDG